MCMCVYVCVTCVLEKDCVCMQRERHCVCVCVHVSVWAIDKKLFFLFNYSERGACLFLQALICMFFLYPFPDSSRVHFFAMSLAFFKQKQPPWSF